MPCCAAAIPRHASRSSWAVICSASSAKSPKSTDPARLASNQSGRPVHGAEGAGFPGMLLKSAAPIRPLRDLIRSAAASGFERSRNWVSPENIYRMAGLEGSGMRNIFAVAWLVVLLSGAGRAQIATTTSLVGTVIDAGGKTVPGARISATNVGTRDIYRVVTTDQGYYNIQFVAVGDYEIVIEQPGFQTARVTRIHVAINQVVRTDVTLKIGNVAESIIVEATAAAIRTDDATVSEVFSMRQVAELPLSFRDPMKLALATPGVLQGGDSRSEEHTSELQ